MRLPRRPCSAPSRQVAIVNRPIRSLCRATAPAGAVARFRTAEDGSLTIFGLVIFVMMMAAGGIALDVMRSEVERTELQYAIDRGVLAAANLEQGRDPGAVVKDYLRAAGLDEDSVEVTSEASSLDRRVSVTAATHTKSLFLDMLGVDELVQPISTEAREVRTELELSLVVDISGSMDGSRIETLRSAASTFVAALLDGRENLTTVSLVPYNHSVNAGTLLAGVFDFTEEHPFSNCIVFPDADYLRLDQASGTRMQRMGHFDFRTYSSRGNAAGLVAEPNCRTDNYAAILPWSNNVTELQSRISQLGARGATAMDLGVKWGTLLLDPSSRDELAELTTSAEVTTGERVNGGFAGRPVDYSAEGTRKVLVVMTDGENTEQWDVKADRRTGNSGVHVVRECAVSPCATPNGTAGTVTVNHFGINLTVNLFGTDGSRCGRVDSSGRIIGAEWGNSPEGTASVTQFQRNRNLLSVGLCLARFDDTENGRYNLRYSIAVPGRGYWVPHLNKFQSTVYEASKAVHLTYRQLLGSVSTSYLANKIIPADSNNYNWNTRVDYFYSWQETHNQSRADANLSRICAAARAQGVIIYTIAFQAPTAGQNAMRDCAGTGNETRYFDVEGLDIAQAFDDVLASVSRLRLTE